MTVLCALLLGDNGRCVAMLEVEPREVLVQSSAAVVVPPTGTTEQQDERRQDQEQQQQPGGTATNVSSAVVKEALFSCLEVRTTV